MQNHRTVEQTLRDVYSLLQAHCASTRNLSDYRIVVCVRTIVGRSEVGRALEQANDTALCFAVREVRHVLSDKSQPPRTIINRVRDIIERPELNPAVGIKQNLGMLLRWKRPPAR
jgi:hypothetical protein